MVTPMETIKTRLIHSGKGLADGVSYVVKKDGVGGLYKGLFPTMAKSCSNQVLHLLMPAACSPLLVLGPPLLYFQ